MNIRKALLHHINGTSSPVFWLSAEGNAMQVLEYRAWLLSPAPNHIHTWLLQKYTLYMACINSKEGMGRKQSGKSVKFSHSPRAILFLKKWLFAGNCSKHSQIVFWTHDAQVTLASSTAVSLVKHTDLGNSQQPQCTYIWHPLLDKRGSYF